MADVLPDSEPEDGHGAEKIALIILSGIIVLPACAIGGRLGDAHSKKRVIVICDLLSVVIYLLCALIPLSMTTIGLMLASAAFQSVERPVYEAFTADLSETKDRTRPVPCCILARTSVISSDLQSAASFWKITCRSSSSSTGLRLPPARC